MFHPSLETWVEIQKEARESVNMEVYYAGFNGFKQVRHLIVSFLQCKLQVPGSSGSDTLTCLTLHSKASKVIDAAICWNYMVLLNSLASWTSSEMYNLEVVAEPDAITKYGLINNRPGQVIKSNSSFTIFPRNT